KGDAGDREMQILAAQGGEERGVETRADALPDRVGRAVDRRLDRGVVGGLGAELVRARVCNDGTALLGDEQSVAPRRTELREPRPTCLDRERLEIEGDRRVDDVVVVDRGDRREIARRGRSDTHRTSSQLATAT